MFFAAITDPKSLAIAGGAAVAVGGVAFGIWRYLKNRPGPAEIERRRRMAIHGTGKLGDGEVIDVEAGAAEASSAGGLIILYSYLVAGVRYQTSQDVSALGALLPEDPMQMIGHVLIKFDPRNPANSIVICESWSGLQAGRARVVI